MTVGDLLTVLALERERALAVSRYCDEAISRIQGSLAAQLKTIALPVDLPTFPVASTPVFGVDKAVTVPSISAIREIGRATERLSQADWAPEPVKAAAPASAQPAGEKQRFADAILAILSAASGATDRPTVRRRVAARLGLEVESAEFVDAFTNAVSGLKATKQIQVVGQSDLALAGAQSPAPAQAPGRRLAAEDVDGHIIEVLREAVIGTRAPQILGLLRASRLPRLTFNQLRYRLRGLVGAGRIQLTGRTTSAVYALPRRESAPPDADPNPAARPEPVKGPDLANAGAQPQRAKVAALVLREILTTSAPMHIADIGLAITDRIGPVGYDDMKVTLDEMVSEGALQTLLKGGDLHYRRVSEPVSVRPAATVSPDVVVATFTTQGSQSVHEVLRTLRLTRPELTAEALQSVLDQLARQRRIEVLTVGTSRRYRRPAHSGVA